MCVCWCGRSACGPPHLGGVRGVGMCVSARVSAAPRHFWLGCWGVRVCVPAPPVPRHSWRGFAAWVCVLGLGFRLHPATPGWGVGLCVSVCVPPLYPATPGWGVGLCVCWSGRSACTPRLLAGVRTVGVCVWAQVSAAPRHSWLGRWAVCVLVCVPSLYPATPGWGVRCGCVCLGSGFGEGRVERGESGNLYSNAG